MNKTFRTIWSVVTQSWHAVSEFVRTVGKKSTKSLRNGVLTSIIISLSLCGRAESQPPPAANQLPTSGSVTQGSATISQNVTLQASDMTVNQTSQRAVVNWETFNLGSSSTLNFIQPNAQAVTLNRVNDSNPSQIFGHITSNAQVFITNASGVYFSPGSSVDVGALVATTHSISDDNFMSGNYVFERNGTTGKIINEGRIKAALGGYVALLAPEVQNAGVVIALAGTVAMAAGEMISLKIEGSGSLVGITTTPNTIATLIENKLAVQAPGGQIILSALALNKLQAGIIKNSGSLEASSLVSNGGKIYLEGDDIALASASKIEAKGATGGGTILIGGDWQGSGTLRQATKVMMEAGATIDASATDKGNGGKVVLWSDVHNAGSITRVSGRIKTEAGVNGGDGGQIETSGHSLQVGELEINAQSFKGEDGLWLLDPYNITISAASNASTANAGNTFTASASGGIVNATTLQNALANNNVTVSTTGAGTDTGNITISTDLAWTSAKVLTLTAAGGITGSGNIAMSGTAGTGVIFNQAGDSTYSGNISGTNATLTKQGTGTLTLSGNNSYGDITTISGGTVKLNSATALGVATNLSANRTVISAGTTLDLNGSSLNEQIYLSGTLTNTNTTAVSNYTGSIFLLAASSITANNGAINLSNLFSSSAGTLVTLDGSTGGSVSGLLGNSGSNQPTVTKNGAGTWSFNGATNYLTGPLNILGGTLKLGSLNTNFFGQLVSGIDISSGASIEIASDNAVIAITTISGAGSILKSGSGTLKMNRSDNSYRGGTTVSAGVLRAGGGTGSYLGASTGAVTVMAGAALDVWGSTFANPITLNGTGINNEGALINVSTGTSTATLSGLLTLGSDSSIMNNATGNSPISITNVGTITGSGYSLTLGGSRDGTITSIIGTGSGSITKSGAGKWTLNGANTYTGNVYVNQGYLVAGNSNALGSTAGSTTVASGASLAIAGATDFAEPLNLSGFGYSDTVGALHSLTTAILNYTGTMTLSGTTRIGVANIKTLNIKSTIDNGEYDIIKYSTGTLNLQGAPNFSGTGSLKTGYAFVQATGSPSVYGTTPVINYQLYTTGAATTLATSVPSTTGTAVFTGSPTSTSSAGSYSLQYNKGLSSTHAFFPVTASSTWVVGKAPLAVTANAADKTYDGLAFSGGNGVSYSGFVNSEASTVLGGSVSYSGTSQGAMNAGSYAITPSGLSSSNYDISYASGALTVDKVPLTVTAAAASKTYDGLAFSGGNGVSYSGLVNSEASTVLGGSVSYSGTSQDAVNTGSYDITPSGLSSINYDISYASGALIVDKAPLTVTAAAASKTYDGLAFSGGNGVSYSGLVNSEASTVLGGSVSYSGTSQDAVNTGSYDITPSGLSSINYDISYASGALTVDKAPLTVTAAAASKTYDGLAFSGGNGVSYSGLVNGEASTALGGSVSYSGTSQGAVNAGSYDITPSGLSSSNYDISYASGALTITSASSSTPNFSQLVNGALTINNGQIMFTANQTLKTYVAINAIGVVAKEIRLATKVTGLDAFTENQYEILRLANGNLIINASAANSSVVNVTNSTIRDRDDGAKN